MSGELVKADENLIDGVLYDRVYKTYPISGAYIQARRFIDLIMGPFGSGKTVASFMRAIMTAREQAPGSDGIRRSRYLVLRNTWEQMKDTGLKTFDEWFPDGVSGQWEATDKTFQYGMDKNGNYTLDPVVDPVTGEITYVSIEFMFRALDRPSQERNLLSLELTGVILIEWRELAFSLIINLSGRVGRYPAPASGATATWSGILGDSNPPPLESDHYKLFSNKELQKQFIDEINKISEVKIDEENFSHLYIQPGGFEPDAENLDHLPGGRAYYAKMMLTAKMQGRDQSWIDVHIHGKFGSVTSGKSVYHESWNDLRHASPIPLHPHPDYSLGIGMDFGAQFTAFIIGQKWPDGTWALYRELVLEGKGLQNSLPILLALLRQQYPNFSYNAFVDPAGTQRSQLTLETAADMVKGAGFEVYLGPKEFQPRKESVIRALNLGMRVDPSMTDVLTGFRGGYHYQQLQKAGEFYTQEPSKNRYSHPHDAVQYLIGFHEAPALVGGYARLMEGNKGIASRDIRVSDGIVMRPKVQLYR